MKLRLREIDHVVLRVTDMQRMVRFYAEVLGAEFVAYRPEFNMTHLRAGSSMIDLVAGDAGAGRNMDHFCLRVEPFDEAAILAHLKSHGVALGETRTRYGAEGNGVSIYLTDPEGNQVELKGPSDGKGPPT
ncbi:MAG TPA: VOC family protein [Burkholderiales bacterium]|jgi:catechol 2,3-dioxygenase-like lactoylglutathione lyase family enzyme